MKIRRLAAAAAALCITLSMSLSAAAEGIDLSGVEASRDMESSVSSEDLKDSSAEKGIFDLGSTDTVTCSNGEYNIKTSTLDVTLFPPFGWLCFTQDLGQQLDLYSMVFKDPTSVAQSFVDSDTHALMIDSSWNFNCEMRFFQDSMSSLIGNSTELSASDEEIVLNHLRTNCYSDCSEATAETYGSNRFFKFVCNDGTFIAYETYVNSVCVDFFLHADDQSAIGSDICSDIEYMLADFKAI